MPDTRASAGGERFFRVSVGADLSAQRAEGLLKSARQTPASQLSWIR